MKKKIDQYSNLTQRIIAALVAVPLIIFCILFDAYTFWALFLLISALTQYEFYKLLGLNGNLPLSSYGTFCGIFINALTFLIETDKVPFVFYYLIIPLLTATFFIKLYKKKDNKPFENLGYTFLGVIYVAIPFALLNEIVIEKGIYRPYLVIGILVILWVNDSGAYFAGRFLGRRKLFERISPKKTWEGFFGGAIFALAAAFIFSRYHDFYDLYLWISIAVIIVVTGTLGDLVESLFKRSIAIKDSGSLIPGHGGFLDRFDGLLLSMPFIVTFLKFFS
ncbi:phosphatidate cytidylyltransferase [Emticicia sp. CRIBPO]|jgi:phosphatidate cytidylyltransferase|uniref:phosphatidate cytidylyltransferase n=1 Tax=Emticicia sp. CRIBPO TaxID=2683258 RepID=UPI001412942F|nr:phosphatidate cytidylyltransferase [Emticicia sp. CRIBPO]NBA86206.1 phosphatidate cytidylyltransferase [Emticicia sp. CRIBPO]